MKRLHASLGVVWVLLTVSAATRTDSHAMWEEPSGPPGAPHNLTGFVSGTTVTVNWQPPTTGGAPTSYVLDASLSPGGPVVGSASIPNTTLTIPSVPNGIYFVRVRGVNSDGHGAHSNEIIVVVPGSGGGVGCASPPNEPDLERPFVNGTTFYLRWRAPVGGCAPTGYILQAGSAFKLSDIAIVNLGLRTELSGDAPFGTYFIRVVAVNAHGAGPASDERTITSAPPLTSLWGAVVDYSGLCIEGATVEVIRGQAVGQKRVQATPCDVWSYGNTGDDDGFLFRDLIPGVEMTLRASAPGWSTEEATFVPLLYPRPKVAIWLTRIQ